jgi:Uma2 family endonuclease
MAITEQRMTLEEFLALPEEKPAWELVGGRVKQKVAANAHHGRLQLILGQLFNAVGEPNRVALAFTETRTTFAGNALVPDVVVYRWDRIPRDQGGLLLADFTSAPDIAVEIISPGQSLRDQLDRCQWCVDHGVEIALCVNTRNQTVVLFRAAIERRTLAGDDRIDLESVLPGFELTVNQLFAALRLG